jgi:hypothetical protein
MTNSRSALVISCTSRHQERPLLQSWLVINRGLCLGLAARSFALPHTDRLTESCTGIPYRRREPRHKDENAQKPPVNQAGGFCLLLSVRDTNGSYTSVFDTASIVAEVARLLSARSTARFQRISTDQSRWLSLGTLCRRAAIHDLESSSAFLRRHHQRTARSNAAISLATCAIRRWQDSSSCRAASLVFGETSGCRMTARRLFSLDSSAVSRVSNFDIDECFTRLLTLDIVSS